MLGDLLVDAMHVRVFVPLAVGVFVLLAVGVFVLPAVGPRGRRHEVSWGAACRFFFGGGVGGTSFPPALHNPTPPPQKFSTTSPSPNTQTVFHTFNRPPPPVHVIDLRGVGQGMEVRVFVVGFLVVFWQGRRRIGKTIASRGGENSGFFGSQSSRVISSGKGGRFTTIGLKMFSLVLLLDLLDYDTKQHKKTNKNMFDAPLTNEECVNRSYDSPKCTPPP